MHFEDEAEPLAASKEACAQAKLSINGEITGRYDWDDACKGYVVFCTNGPHGGDAGYNGFLKIEFANVASTYLDV